MLRFQVRDISELMWTHLYSAAWASGIVWVSGAQSLFTKLSFFGCPAPTSQNPSFEQRGASHHIAQLLSLANFFNDSVIMRNLLFVASAALFLSACASPARYAWVKEGASDHQRTNDTSECTYQVRLNKTPVAEQKELHRLCMQGKGYRMKRVG